MKTNLKKIVLSSIFLGFSFYCFSINTWQAPKTWFGDPDLQGVWTNASLTTLERPDYFEKLIVSPDSAKRLAQKSKMDIEAYDNQYEIGETPSGGENVGGYNIAWMDPGSELFKINGEYRSSIIIDPENGKLPYSYLKGTMTAWKLWRKYGKFGTDHPENRTLGERCIVGFGSSGGPPMLSVLYNNHYQFVQSPGYVMILVEMNHDARIIRINDKHKPNHVKQWMGDSVGYWEDNTLVIETKNMHPQQGFRASLRHVFYLSENAKVIERFTRISDSEIFYQFSVDDPEVYTQVWSGEMPLKATSNQIYEYACHEGNYSLSNILAGARAKERKE